ncbi:MAG: FGGY-family carbohydrate kinase, partial [Candidatus Faecivicinus sp.]|nr:FGGY-family carbohydrate kinase [Candidatus Faecivicinus sp.]
TTGSCLAVTAVVDRFIPYHPEMQLTCQNYAVPGRYAILLWSQSAGMTLKWFAQKFYSEYERLGDAFDQINREAEGVDTGCNGLTMLPHLTGAANPEYDAYARGAFSGATLEHGRGHFARAIMEAVACMLRRNLEQLDAVGVKTDSVYCLGGGVNSRLWLQIKADLTGKTMIPLRSQESACLGAAILAGVGAGEYESVDWIPEGRENAERIAPEVDQQSAGEEAYRRYIALYDALKPFFARNACERGENLC